MQWYQLLATDDHSPADYFRARDGEFPTLPKKIFRESEPIPSWDRHSWVGARDATDDGIPDSCLFNTHSFVILSMPVQAAVMEAGIAVDDVEFLPIHVRKSTGDEVEGYSVLNVLWHIELIDREKCFMLKENEQIDPRTGKPQIRNIGRPAVFGDRLAGHDIVRPLDYPHMVVVSERFADLWKGHGFTGALPRELAVSDDPAPPDFKSIRFPLAEIVGRR